MTSGPEDTVDDRGGGDQRTSAPDTSGADQLRVVARFLEAITTATDVHVAGHRPTAR